MDPLEKRLKLIKRLHKKVVKASTKPKKRGRPPLKRISEDEILFEATAPSLYDISDEVECMQRGTADMFLNLEEN